MELQETVKKENRTLAIFGGTFDPPHLGHLAIAEQVLANDLAGEVMFVPAAKPPHKLDKQITSGKHRLEMLEILIKDKPGFSISDYEIVNKMKNSYTIHTLRAMKTVFHNKKIALIVGMDNFLDFDTWFKFEEIIENYQLIVFTRPGYRKAPMGEIVEKFGHRKAEQLANSIIEINYDVSSTEIRNLAEERKDFSKYVTEEVMYYINENKLYG